MSKVSRKTRNQNHAVTKQVPPQERQLPAYASITTKMELSESLPPPSMLGDYNLAVQDGAERIMKMAESQHAHRLRIEDRVIGSDIVRSYIGLVIGAVIIIVALICGTYLIASGKDAQGLLIGVGAMGAGLGTFIWGYKKRTEQVDDMRRNKL